MTNENQKIAELIDACRPTGPDLDLPEMSPLAAALATDASVAERLHRSQRMDAVIGSAVRDLPIPPGLEERLFATLAAHSLMPVAPTITPPVVDAALRHRSRWRTWSAWSGAAMAVAALLVLALFLRTDPTPSFASQQDVAEYSRLWLASVEGESEAWSSAPPPTPIPALPSFTIKGWRHLPNIAGGVCYDVTRSGPRALLFVMQSSAETNLPKNAPLKPYPAKPDWTVGGWQVNGLTFVLAVQGDEASYRRIVQPKNQVAMDFRNLAQT